MEQKLDVDLDDLAFFVGAPVTEIVIGHYEVRLCFETVDAQLTVYGFYEYYSIERNKKYSFDADEKKGDVVFLSLLGKVVQKLSINNNLFFVFSFTNDDELILDVEADGYESFLINGPKKSLWAFNGYNITIWGPCS